MGFLRLPSSSTNTTHRAATSTIARTTWRCASTPGARASPVSGRGRGHCIDLAFLITSGVLLVAYVVALAVPAWDRSRPIAWWQGATVLWLLGAFGWTVAAILSPERRLLFAILATGLMLPPTIWLSTMGLKRRHTQGGEASRPRAACRR